MRAYPLEFRQKIIDTYYDTPISQRALAQKFNVALSFVSKLLKQNRETGNLDPKSSPGRPRKLSTEHESALLQMVEEHNDWTLKEYQAELKEQMGIEISTTTICRILQNLGYPRKKNDASHRERERESPTGTNGVLGKNRGHRS